MPEPIKPTAPTSKPADPRDELLAQMRTALANLSAEVASLKHAANKPPEPEKVPLITTKKAWEEEIWVEALRDCTYPDPHDWYQKYRLGRREGQPGDRFRLMHREHLVPGLHREIKPGDPDQVPAPVVQQVPQMGARGVRTNVMQL